MGKDIAASNSHCLFILFLLLLHEPSFAEKCALRGLSSLGDNRESRSATWALIFAGGTATVISTVIIFLGVRGARRGVEFKVGPGRYDIPCLRPTLALACLWPFLIALAVYLTASGIWVMSTFVAVGCICCICHLVAIHRHYCGGRGHVGNEPSPVDLPKQQLLDLDLEGNLAVVGSSSRLESSSTFSPALTPPSPELFEIANAETSPSSSKRRLLLDGVQDSSVALEGLPSDVFRQQRPCRPPADAAGTTSWPFKEPGAGPPAEPPASTGNPFSEAYGIIPGTSQYAYQIFLPATEFVFGELAGAPGETAKGPGAFLGRDNLPTRL